MLSGGALRLTQLYAVSPGTRAVVATTSDRGLEAAASWRTPGSRSSRSPTCATTPSRGAASSKPRDRGARTATRSSRRRAASRSSARRARADRRRGALGREDVRVRSRRGLGRVRAGDVAAAPGRCPQPTTTPRGAASCSTSCRRTCPPPATVAGFEGADAIARSGERAGLSAAGAPAGEASDGSEPTPTHRAPGRGAATGCRRGPRQVLRVPVRGRNRQGHQAERRGGLRLDRAVQAVHDRDDGSVPGPHVPAPGDPADGRGDRAEPRAGRYDDRAPAVGVGADGGARGPAVRARQALLDPRAPPRARREHQVGGRLAARVRLRRPAGRGARGAPGRGADRRLDARQAARPRTRRRRVPRPPVSRTASATSSPAGSATA